MTPQTCVATDTKISHSQHRAQSHNQSLPISYINRSESPHSSVSRQHRLQVDSQEPSPQGQALPQDCILHQQDHGPHQRHPHHLRHDGPTAPRRHHLPGVVKEPSRGGLHQPDHLEQVHHPRRARRHPGHNQRGQERKRQIRGEQCTGQTLDVRGAFHHPPAGTTRHDHGTISTTSLRLFDHNLLPHFNNNFTNHHHNLTTDTNNTQDNFYHNFLPRFNFNFLTK